MGGRLDNRTLDVKPAHAAPLEVLYVTTCFPVPSETFACVEISELVRRGVNVTVRSLGPSTSVDPEMLFDYDLGHLDRSSGGLSNFPRSLLACCYHPFAAARLFVKALLQRRLSLSNWLRNVAIVPRSVEVFHEVLKRRPDVVHLFWGHFPSQVSWLLHRCDIDQAWSVSLGAYDMRMEYPLTCEVLPHAKFVRSLTNDSIPSLMRLGAVPETVKVIYHGIHLPALERPPKRNRHQIVFAGRLIEQKGLNELLEVYVRVKREFPQAQLIVAGDGPMRSELERRLREDAIKDVELLGHVSQSELRTTMLKSGVFLFLSHVESLPNVVKEAMACGCHCVVSDTDGIRELVPGPEFGWVVPQRDIDAALEATRNAMTRHEADIRLRATDHVTRHFSVEQTTSALIKMWSDVTQKRDCSTTR